MLLMAFAIACVDESKDPVKFNEVKKATILALRGDSFDALNASGCSNSFFADAIIGTEVFSVTSDFLSIDQESLQEVQVFASIPASQLLTPRPRTKVATIPGSTWTVPAEGGNKRGTFSVPLATIIAALNIPPDSIVEKLGNQDITIDTDLLLTDGSKVLASALVNVNLFQSVVFYPAQTLVYCANQSANFVPIATTSLLGTWAVKDGVVVRTKIPSLKDGAKDTLYITYDNPIITPPTVAFTPTTAGTATALVKAKKKDAKGFYTADDSDNAFYLVYTANGTPAYTGGVAAKVTGATAEVAGVILTQDPKTQTINVDNTPPVLLDKSTGTRIGKNQFVTMTVSFNEKLSTSSSKAIKVNVPAGQGLEAVVDAKMTVAADGLSASYIYVFKLVDPLVAATHGDLTVSFSNAIDEAGNTTAISNGTLTVDVGIPPAPTLALNGVKHDYGTQILWTATQTTGGANPSGSTTGKEYFIAITTGKPGPTAFSVDLDGVATWTMPDDPASITTPKAKVSIKQSGTVAVKSGTSGEVYTPFTANGDVITTPDSSFDIYAVFVSSTGTISAISAPQLTQVVMK